MQAMCKSTRSPHWGEASSMNMHKCPSGVVENNNGALLCGEALLHHLPTCLPSKCLQAAPRPIVSAMYGTRLRVRWHAHRGCSPWGHACLCFTRRESRRAIKKQRAQPATRFLNLFSITCCAVCPYAFTLPGGSWAASCTSITVDSSACTVNATCKADNGSSRSSSVSLFACPSRKLAVTGGLLACED